MHIKDQNDASIRTYFQVGHNFVLIAMAGCERNLGKLLFERVVENGDIKILIQVYDIPWYSKERGVMFWCKSSHTLDASSSREARPTKLNIKETGWKNWMRTDVVVSSVDKEALIDVAAERVHIVNDRFAYVDMGVGAVALTFDGCASKVNLFSHQVYEAMPTQGVLVDHESIGRHADGLAPPLFHAFDRRKVGDEESYCFDINPGIQNTGEQRNQICTKDNGMRWHHSRVGG